MEKLNRTDAKWAHPESFEEGWYTITMNPDFREVAKYGKEQAQANVDAMSKGLYDMLGAMDTPAYTEVEWKEYRTDKGCPEEPGMTGIRVLVATPKDRKEDEKLPAVFCISGGGLVAGGDAAQSAFLGRTVIADSGEAAIQVCFDYRIANVAPYPAAVNDCHVVYAWMIEHAEELHIDTDRIVLWGTSSGGHLSLCTAFRLKRYDWCGAPMPRGVVVDDGMFDDFETTRSMRVISKTWCGLTNRAANMLYMGDNFASGFVGPEAYANHATVEECRNLPPYLIYEGQDNPGADPGLEFAKKLNEAGVQCTMFMWGGTTHSRPAREDNALILPFLNLNIQSEYQPRTGCDGAALIENFIVGGVKDMLAYDMRRLPKEK